MEGKRGLAVVEMVVLVVVLLTLARLRCDALFFVCVCFAYRRRSSCDFVLWRVKSVIGQSRC